jgi:hypothetical protein
VNFQFDNLREKLWIDGGLDAIGTGMFGGENLAPAKRRGSKLTRLGIENENSG